MKIGQAIRQLRERFGMTQEQLALAAGFDAGNLSRIELGRQNPSLNRLMAIAQALSVPVSDITLIAESLAAGTASQRLSEASLSSPYSDPLLAGLNTEQLEIIQAVAETLRKQNKK